jgi:hypothetical protein
MALRNMFKAIKPEDVFTPRGDKVRDDMYISRPRLEQSLRNALRMSKHVVIHGESGSGKSWLYKKVLKEDKAFFEVVNLGLARSSGSIASVIQSALARHARTYKSGYTESKEAGVNVVAATGKLQHTDEYKIRDVDVFEDCLQLIRDKAGARNALLVFDNLEHILVSPQLVSELAGFLLLLDDSNYAKYAVKILLVGTSNDMRSYISKASNSNTITNRLIEIPEVSRLDVRQASALIYKGLFDLLSYDVQEEEKLNEKDLIAYLSYYSDRIPQYLQEICLHLALEAENNDGIINFDIFDDARHEWIKSSLISELAVVESNMNSRSTKIGRKNQVIYALGQCKEYDFTCSHIEDIVRKEFPLSCTNIALNVAQILSELSKSEMPIIRRSPRGSAYRFVDPKLRIIIRLKMQKLSEEQLYLRSFDDSVSYLN